VYHLYYESTLKNTKPFKNTLTMYKGRKCMQVITSDFLKDKYEITQMIISGARVNMMALFTRLRFKSSEKKWNKMTSRNYC